MVRSYVSKSRVSRSKALIFYFGFSLGGSLLALGCGANTVGLTPLAPESGTVSNSGPDVVAGLVQIQACSSEPLPDRLQVQSTTFASIASTPSGCQIYTSRLKDVFLPFQPIEQITLDNGIQAEVRVKPTAATRFIYLSDPTTVTFDDFVLVFALSRLPESQRTPDNLAVIANELFTTRSEPYNATDFDPVPDSFNTDFVAGGASPAPDLADAAAVFVAFNLPVEQRTPTNIANGINALIPGFTLTAADIQSIPGQVDNPFQVTTLNDTGVGSLRAIIEAANAEPGPNVITFNPGLSGTLTLASALPMITDDLDIQGLGADTLAISGDDTVRVLTIAPDVSVGLQGLTIQDGFAEYGGGIMNSGTLDIQDCVITGNLAAENGGAIVSMTGTLTVTSSTLSDNSAMMFGGGISSHTSTVTIANSLITGNAAGDDSGALDNVGGEVTIIESVITSNVADDDAGAIFSGSQGTVTVIGSTLSANQAGDLGGAFLAVGNSILNVNNSTVSGNSTTNSGGAIAANNATIEVSNTTLAANTASTGASFSSFFSTFNVSNSLLVNPSGSENCDSVVIDATNLSNDASCGNAGVESTAGNGSVFGPLAVNGTLLTAGVPGDEVALLTHALLSGHPGLDQGNNAQIPSFNGSPVVFDQRGQGFDRISNGTVDVGAYEFQVN